MAATTAAAADLPASQASSHFVIEPMSAAVLRRRETKRREALRKRGPVKMGCGGVDDYVLMGGFERGSVVGISAESEEMGLMVSLQALATHLCGDEGVSAIVITTQPPASVLPGLRDAVKAELTTRGAAVGEVRQRLRGCLERVSVSRVFDLDGLWEVLGDLDIPPASPPSSEGLGDGKETVFLVPASSEPEEMEKIVLPELKPKTEIADSDEEEEGFSPPPTSSSELSELSPPPSSMLSMLATPEASEAPGESGSPEIHDRPEADVTQALPEAVEKDKKSSPGEEPKPPGPPDVILVTHFSSLLTALFTRHDRASAHDALQSLSAHLRYLSRTLPSSPLVLLLNSTSSGKHKSAVQSSTAETPQGPPLGESPVKNASKPLDPTLCSIFNPPPLDLPGYVSWAPSRRNKPSFGLVFSQLLDLHVLCTRVPRGKEDGDASGVPLGAVNGQTARYVWVVEVLLDEMGVWEGASSTAGRRFREQRWAPVDVRAGRIVDAFDEVAERKNTGDVRVVGGFGGPRV